MPLSIHDPLLLLLLGGIGGLLIGVGLSTAIRHRVRTVSEAEQAPRSAAPRAAPAGPAPPLAADLLLVDDSAVARSMLRRLFEPAGYRVHLAKDGVEALSLLAQGKYAMMITDLEMPNMDGVALITACRSHPEIARMPILAITGHESLASKFDECGDICGVHRKPWVDDILLSHVVTLVGPRRARAVPAAAGPRSPVPSNATRPAPELARH